MVVVVVVVVVVGVVRPGDWDEAVAAPRDALQRMEQGGCGGARYTQARHGEKQRVAGALQHRGGGVVILLLPLLLWWS